MAMASGIVRERDRTRGTCLDCPSIRTRIALLAQLACPAPGLRAQARAAPDRRPSRQESPERMRERNASLDLKGGTEFWRPTPSRAMPRPAPGTRGGNGRSATEGSPYGHGDPSIVLPCSLVLDRPEVQAVTPARLAVDDLAGLKREHSESLLAVGVRQAGDTLVCAKADGRSKRRHVSTTRSAML